MRQAQAAMQRSRKQFVIIWFEPRHPGSYERVGDGWQTFVQISEIRVTSDSPGLGRGEGVPRAQDGTVERDRREVNADRNRYSSMPAGGISFWD
jgi:hypothetical protein